MIETGMRGSGLVVCAVWCELVSNEQEVVSLLSREFNRDNRERIYRRRD